MAENETPREGSRTPALDPQELAATLAALRDEAMATIERLGRQLEIDRRMRENPLAVLGVAAGAGFVLGGGVWPVLRPFLRSMFRTALSPSNLMAIAAALGAMRVAQSERTPPASEPTGGPMTH